MTENVRDTWATPLWLVRLLEARLGGAFDLDVAAAAHNAKAPRYWTRDDNGLAQSWASERAFCNPPFSAGQQTRFVWRAIAAVANGEVRIGMGLITLGDVSTRYWSLLEAAGAERVRLRGRWGCEPPPGVSASTAKATMVPWILRRTLSVSDAIELYGTHVEHRDHARGAVNAAADEGAST